MPIDKPDAQVVPTNRRTFLARAAAGGALVAVGTAVGPLGRLLPVAAQGAPTTPGDAMDDNAVGTQLAPVELAAVAAYEAALGMGKLTGEWADTARRFQSHHLTAANDLSGLVADGPAPTADPTVLAGTVATIEGTSDQNTILGALSELESILAAAHLWAAGSISDKITARIVGQVLAVESQQAAYLGLNSGADLASITPAVGEIRQPPAPAPATTETTAAGEVTETDEEAGN